MCFSWYSLMSKRSRGTLSTSASCRASSVLPTPVGPTNRNLATGLSASRKPARERLMAQATFSTAWSWPKIAGFQLRLPGGAGCCLSDSDTLRRGILAMLGHDLFDGVDADGRIAPALVRGVHARQRPGLVDDVDGLVGQEAVVDVLARQLGRRLQHFVGVGHLVVFLVAPAQAQQDLVGFLDRSARGSRSSGSGATGPGPSRSISCTPRGWWCRCSAACPGPAPASGCWRRPASRPRPRRRR